LRKIFLRTVLFARMSPNQKARVVRVLRDCGNIVGFLGDGVNDALAIRESDVGVSVDSGSDLAKDAADIILTEKNLDVLLHAIEQGRQTQGNTIKYIKMAASSNFGNVFSILVASAWLPFLPMLPIHLLTQNLLYDISQLVIPWDRMDDEYVRRPQAWNAKNLAMFMVFIGPISSIFDITTFLWCWFVFDYRDPSHQTQFQSCWFILGLVTQTLIVHMIRTEHVPFIQSRATWIVCLMTVFISGIGILLPNVPASANVLTMAAPPALFYPYLFAAMFCYMILIHFAKRMYIRKFKSWL